MKVFWTFRATHRLKLISKYIEAENPTAAKKVVAGLLTKSMTIATMEKMGRVVPEFQRDEIRELLCRPYRVIYCIREERIDILTVIYYRQLLPEDYSQL